MDNLEEEPPEDRAPRRPRCCARAGGGTCPTRREASAECPSLQIQFTRKKSNILGKCFMSPASSAALITGLFQSKSSQMARPRRPRGVSTTTTCNVKMTTVNTTTGNDGGRIDHLRCWVDVVDWQLGCPKVVPVPSCVRIRQELGESRRVELTLLVVVFFCILFITVR